MKINANEIKVGMLIEYKDDLWEILKTQHVKPGKGGAFCQVEMKSINKNTKLNERFRSNDTIEKANIENIEFISSINKLKPYLGNLKTNYHQRKKYGIEICKCYLNQFELLIQWQSYFNQNKKKDDLADCFLQALSYFFKKNILKNKIIINAVDLKV